MLIDVSYIVDGFGSLVFRFSRNSNQGEPCETMFLEDSKVNLHGFTHQNTMMFHVLGASICATIVDRPLDHERLAKSALGYNFSSKAKTR